MGGWPLGLRVSGQGQGLPLRSGVKVKVEPCRRERRRPAALSPSPPLRPSQAQVAQGAVRRTLVPTNRSRARSRARDPAALGVPFTTFDFRRLPRLLRRLSRGAPMVAGAAAPSGRSLRLRQRRNPPPVWTALPLCNHAPPSAVRKCPIGTERAVGRWRVAAPRRPPRGAVRSIGATPVLASRGALTSRFLVAHVAEEGEIGHTGWLIVERGRSSP